MDEINDELNQQIPRIELPGIILDATLSNVEQISDGIYDSLKVIKGNRGKMRKELEEKGIIRKDTDIGESVIPTTCGVDGAYAVEKLFMVDIVGCAAITAEGFPPSPEKQYWDKPYYTVFTDYDKHSSDPEVIIRGVMMEMEIELAAKAPHDVVFIDGSLTTHLIGINQAINKVIEEENSGKITKVGNELKKRFVQFLKDYKMILESSRKDRLWVGVPKYTSRREFGTRHNWPSDVDDRAVFNIILSPGEFTEPVPIEPPQQWHINVPYEDEEIQKLKDEIISEANNIHVMYYKPIDQSHVFRIEIPFSVASDNSRIAMLLQGIKYQTYMGRIMELFPLYLADKYVKHFGNAISILKQASIKRMSELHQEDTEEIIKIMHSYRTEGGKHE
jgi:hypothetical protein